MDLDYYSPYCTRGIDGIDGIDDDDDDCFIHIGRL